MGAPRVEPGYLSLKDLARYSGLSVNTLRGLVNKPPHEALPVIRLGIKLLIKRSDWDAYAEARKTVGKPSLTQALTNLGLMTREEQQICGPPNPRRRAT